MNHKSDSPTPAWILVLYIFILALPSQELHAPFTYDHGGIIRGDRTKKEIALVFTGDT